ncbi:MULE transposase domain [Dillenia turbinata]|uniref:Protein FAR1-RELATED SEQUENCE n=1 Tax=Dillenia turbinata TaxID=194707 RepID=A0AAN8USI0_9MAGN
MEIDLELPSNGDERVDAEADLNASMVNSSLEMHAVEEHVHLPTIAEHVKESAGLSKIETAIGCGTGNKQIFIGPRSCEPQIGLQFESKEAAYSFYREYARSVGFGITIKASRRSKKSGKFIDVKIACSRFGNKREPSANMNPRSCPKTDCKAGMHMKRMQDGKWVIYNFVEEHNHEICPDDFYSAIRGRNKQSNNVSCQKKGLQLALDEGDVPVILDYFMQMQGENPNFFYAIDLDHERRLRNIFWVDPKSRQDYRNFSDVVFFDLTYVKSKYKIPFVPIVGVNNHFQFMLLGCALIGDEVSSAYTWLMRTWFRAMDRQSPKVIITDQDKYMKETVAEVFPNARHCYCLWHIFKKIPEQFSPIVADYENFLMKFNKCIYRSFSVEVFEKRWWKLVGKHGLREDELIQALYEDRRMWVPIFMHDTFLAGMSTTERSGSIISFMDRYLSRETTVKAFVKQYKEILQDRLEEEAKADFETRHRNPTLKSLSPFEMQMSKVYTHQMFRKFQVEVLGMTACHPHKVMEDGTTVSFQVDDFEEHPNFIVTWNERNLEVGCSCYSFQYRGFLCRHAMVVLQVSGVSAIPSHYILQRWSQDAKINQTMSEVANGLRYRVLRFNDLCKLAVKLGAEGSLSNETYQMALRALEETMTLCVGMNNSVRNVSEPSSLATHGFLDIEEENHCVTLAKATKKNKKRKRKKVSSEPEEMTVGMQESHQQLEQLNSRAHIIDDTRVPQSDIQVMERINTRVPPLDGYYDSQQMGQLNPLTLMREAYYGNQQNMQGLAHLNSIPSRPYGTQQCMQGPLGYKAATMHGCLNIPGSYQDAEQSIGVGHFHGPPTKFS